MYARHNAPSWVHSVQVSTDLRPDPGSSTEVFLEESSRGRLTGTFDYCPRYTDGTVGKYHLGESEVLYYDADGNDLGEFIDTSRGYVTIKQSARFVGVKAKRKGKTVTVSARPQYWSIGAYGEVGNWSSANWANNSKSNRLKKQFALQRRTANGRGTWRTVKRVVPPKGTTLAIKLKARKRFQYRIVSTGTARTFATTSRVVRR
ncbi:hypothetical protein GCM10022196_02950 [Aeromicrobium flavum]